MCCFAVNLIDRLLAVPCRLPSLENCTLGAVVLLRAFAAAVGSEVAAVGRSEVAAVGRSEVAAVAAAVRDR